MGRRTSLLNRLASLLGYRAPAVLGALVGIVTTLAVLALPVPTAPGARGPVAAGSDHEERFPDGFHPWLFAGAPLASNALYACATAFPGFHRVYVEPGAFVHYRRTGEFPEGTIIVEERVTMGIGPRGRGYFSDRLVGVDPVIKDSARSAATGGWGLFDFGYRAPPCPRRPAVRPIAEGTSCHHASARGDMVFTRFHPVLGQP